MVKRMYVRPVAYMYHGNMHHIPQAHHPSTVLLVIDSA